MDLKGESAWDREEFSATFRQFEPYFKLSADELPLVRRQWWEEAMGGHCPVHQRPESDQHHRVREAAAA